MNTRLALHLCLLSIGCTTPLPADVRLRQEPEQADAPWAATCGGGTLVAFTQPSPGKAVPEPMEGWNYFAQSIVGNGQYLTGFSFYGTGLNSPPVTYTISVLSYGPVVSPIDSVQEFNPGTSGSVVATASFVLGKSTDGRLCFEFSGDDRILLKEGHGYVLLLAPEATGTARFYRMPDGSGYPSGACAKGPTILSPGVFNQSGADRDAVFALYTAAQ